ncbi:MAG: hypothetical protein KJP18_15310 [Gemmatimonadetes bacterium]|nr:hypothetical protein [Gemmatimonadota bacterium]NNK63082.1 hypothetical protein [Gemmatimonadota bacterium]
MRDDTVIHLDDYRRSTASDPRAGLSLAGAEGGRRHFTLPLWRMASATGADWAGLVRWTGDGPDAVTVVDLDAGPARSEPAEGLPRPTDAVPPDIRMVGSQLTLALGRYGGDSWGVVLGGAAVTLGSVRDQLLFLAGECAGLLALEAGTTVTSPEGEGLSPSDPSDA